MNRIKYILEKIKRAQKSGTLSEKGVRFFRNQTLRYIVIPLKSLFRFNNNLQLNFTNGFIDHRANKNFLKIRTHGLSEDCSFKHFEYLYERI